MGVLARGERAGEGLVRRVQRRGPPGAKSERYTERRARRERPDLSRAPARGKTRDHAAGAIAGETIERARGEAFEIDRGVIEFQSAVKRVLGAQSGVAFARHADRFGALARRPAAWIGAISGEDRGKADDVALFLLSGGTTGYSKLIPRTHDDYSYNFRRSSEIAGFDENTRYLAALPVSHNFPLGSPGALGVFERGGTVVLTDDPSPANALKMIERERITHTAVVPTIALRWIESPVARSVNLSSLRVLQVGGARLAEEVGSKIQPVLGCTLQQVFGMAEGLLNFTRLDDAEDLIVSSQGYSMCSDDELRFVDENGKDVPDGSPGELLVRGPYTLRGYYDAPEHNARSFTKDGYYRTGDVVRRLPTGHLVVEGRVKDLINRGGEKISAEDVENHLLAHPRIRDASVVAMPDREFGERACAFIVTRGGEAIDLQEVTSFLAGRRIAKFLYPERVEVVDALPLTNVGKVNKKALRDTIAAKLSTVSIPEEHGCG